MMNSKEFNKLAANLMMEELGPLGFKKSRSTVAIYQPPKIMTVYKHTFRGTFLGYYLAVTYEFMHNATVEKGKALPPPYVEGYPTSISIFRVCHQFEKHNHISEFECGLHLHSWDEGLPAGAALGGLFAERSLSPLVTSSAKAAEQYIRETVEDVKANGMKFLNQVTPTLSLEFLERHFKDPCSLVDPLKEDLRSYLADRAER